MGVFTPFLENGTTFVSQGRFRNTLAACLFFPPHISPSGTPVVFFLTRGCFCAWPKFRQACKNPVFQLKNIYFSVKCVNFHIGQCVLSPGQWCLFVMLVIVVSLRLSFPPPAAPVPGAVIVHANIFVVFCVYFVHKTFFLDFFFAIVFSFSCASSAR